MGEASGALSGCEGIETGVIALEVDVGERWFDRVDRTAVFSDRIAD